MNPIWVGKFDVVGTTEIAILDGHAGAFVWIASQADDSTKFVSKVEHAMRQLGLNVNEQEDVRIVDADGDLPEKIADLISEARSNSESVVCGTWHLYKSQHA